MIDCAVEKAFYYYLHGLAVAGGCVESTSTHSQLTTVASDSSSSPILVNFTYFNISTTAASSAPPYQLVHATSTMTPPRRLTSSATHAAIGRSDNTTTSRDMHMNNASSAPVTWWAVNVSDSSRTTTSVLQVRSSESTANSTSGGVPTSSGLPPRLPGDVSSVDDISSLPTTTPSPQYFRPSPLWSSVVAVVVCLLVLVVLLVTLIVCLLRARSRHKLCWTKHRCYLPVPLFYQNGGGGGSRPAGVVVDPPATAVTVTGNGAPANGPELAPLTCV